MQPWQPLLDFWFGDDSGDAPRAARQAPLWWGKSRETDALLAHRFGELAQAAAEGELAHWAEVPVGRLALILPLEHAESREQQARSVALFEALAAELADGPARETFEGFADFARRHQVIIQRFGRFPHRNTILGRTSTPEEAEFLQQPGSGF
ncbi:DUF924 family protein [Aeromonas rivipollensis]|uniref:DUF924 family protein n=1 Tax=Aeromonas rivipollensis TaxID=948519 RepID=UPI00373AEF74